MSDAGNSPVTRPVIGGAAPLFAPWRASYMDLLSRQADAQDATANDPQGTTHAAGASSSCFLRSYWNTPQGDVEHRVIVRTGEPAPEGTDPDRGGMILLNAYPYANGHLLVALGEGRARLLDYNEAQRRELWSLVDLATELCERTLACQGVNIGINQGAAAGAGVPGHLHVHIVPRWHGDVNFMASVGQVRLIPGALDAMAERYRAAWAQLRSELGLG